MVVEFYLAGHHKNNDLKNSMHLYMTGTHVCGCWFSCYGLQLRSCKVVMVF